MLRRDPSVALPLLAVVIAQLLINAATLDWWAGYSFGSRRMIGCLPCFAVGIHALFQAVQKRAGLRRGLYAVLGVLTVCNLGFWVQFRTWVLHHGEAVPWTRVFSYPLGGYAGLVRRIVNESTVRQLWVHGAVAWSVVVTAGYVLGFALVCGSFVRASSLVADGRPRITRILHHRNGY